MIPDDQKVFVSKHFGLCSLEFGDHVWTGTAVRSCVRGCFAWRARVLALPQGSGRVRARCKSDIPESKERDGPRHSHAIDAACRAGDDGYDDMFIKINGRGTNRNYEV